MLQQRCHSGEQAHRGGERWIRLTLIGRYQLSHLRELQPLLVTSLPQNQKSIAADSGPLLGADDGAFKDLATIPISNVFVDPGRAVIRQSCLLHFYAAHVAALLLHI